MADSSVSTCTIILYCCCRRLIVLIYNAVSAFQEWYYIIYSSLMSVLMLTAWLKVDAGSCLVVIIIFLACRDPSADYILAMILALPAEKQTAILSKIQQQITSNS